MTNSKNVTVFLATLAEKVAKGEFVEAIATCKNSKERFVRAYVAIAFVNGFDAEELITRMNDIFLDKAFDKNELIREVKFHYNTLVALPMLKDKVRKTPLYQ